MNQSSCCNLFNKFKNNKEFCISYKKTINWDICNNDIAFNEEISSPIFSIDDEDIQLCYINSILKNRYSCYISVWYQCFKNNIKSYVMFWLVIFNYQIYLLIL